MKSIELKAGCGIFGLNEHNHFFKDIVAPIQNENNNCELILNFSEITYWDISALLLIIIALDYFQKKSKIEEKNIKYKFYLPQPSNDNLPVEEMTRQDFLMLRSADYLRRWRFYDALYNLVNDPEELFIDSQKNYINCEPKHFYRKGSRDLDGLYEELISLNLVEIRNLVDIALPKEQRKVEKNLIRLSFKEFVDKAVGPILSNRCNIEKDTANSFVTHLLLEGITNCRQHPNATIGMFSLSKFRKDQLILSIIDNGDPITKTIYDFYKINHKEKKLPDKYAFHELSAIEKANILNYATMEGVSRKWLNFSVNQQLEIFDSEYNNEQQIGMGLTHIRNKTVNSFNGNLIITSDGVSIKYKQSNVHNEINFVNYNFPWTGNLLRICIPIVEKSSILLNKNSIS